ncbi:ABC transporter ATP-binding protein [Nocardioides sp. zg-1228]|uniref:dipeptide ABC transporter ATP-binding protein n=1 Tax=Nocardioides sp. zg-1228 TaxID=2763008 RepID=UPI0016435401|nr:ABC transporter ATP-binding protein [Nocardioides sp. zg-1228]MBC2934638.1 ABC transporter ATP-binding protein [Nocardioides sp. zg-1228]QSF59383.1 ABC transporter ATP-binding protein [Nocardioides sp. zg-1228]
MPSDAETTPVTTQGTAQEAVPEAAPLLRITDLEVSYYGTPALHGVDLTVAEGERVALVGESGSGKSTTAAAVIGLLPGGGTVTRGRIEFRGEDVTHADERRLRRLRGRQVGLVPQDPMSNLNPATRVGQQVAETLVAHRLASRREARRRAVELLGEAGIPDAERRSRQYPHEFSGGMRQRVLIAIALACEPDLLIADEPTSALDVTVQRTILDHLETLRAERGASMLLVTHDLGLAADRADRVVVMSEGRIVEQGPARELLRHPQHEYTQRLVAAAPSVASARVAAGAPVGVRTEPRDGSSEQGTGPILAVEHLTKEYHLRGGRGRLTAVDDVSFEVPAGTTTAVVGESGSGKTTVARMVLGLVTPTAGEVRVDGAHVAAARGAKRRAIRRVMQPVFQDPYASLDPMFTVEHIVDEPLRVFGVGDRRTRRARVADLLDHVALPHSVAQRHPNELSGGQRQRVAIARALALNPRLVVCDEAVSALDVLVQDQILTLLADLQRDLGLSYLFITHDLAVVRLVAQDVVVMQQGRLVETGAVDDVFERPSSDYTRELLAAIPGAGVFS